MLKQRKSGNVNHLNRLLVLLVLISVIPGAYAFDASVKASSIHMAQNPWYDAGARTTPAATNDFMQAQMINVDGLEEFVYLANGYVKVRPLHSNGDVGYPLVIGRDTLLKVNFTASQPGVAVSRIKAWVTLYNDVNASNGQSIALTDPSGTSPIVEFPVSFNHQTPNHSWEDSHTLVISGNLIQPGFRWVLNWLVYEPEPDSSGGPAISSSHQITSQVLKVSKFDAYTPPPSNWREFNEKPFEGTSQHTSHAPDDLFGINWNEETWDGTPYDPTTMTDDAFYNAVCPNGRVRGLRELYYQHNPFTDPRNPTKGEVDEWHRLLINHIRTLVGFPMPEYEIHKDYCTFAKSQWFEERKQTSRWDNKYPGGTCGPDSGAHCGFTFTPNPEDQGPFLPAKHPSCGPGYSGSEGILGASPGAPWSVKLSGSFCGTLNLEGYWGAHIGPFWGRTKFGLSFFEGRLRANWTGSRLPQLHCNPASPSSSPECGTSENAPNQ